MDFVRQVSTSWPMRSLVFSFILCLIATWLIPNTIRSYRCLSHIPGPLSAHFSKRWVIRGTMAGDMPFRVANVCPKYGSLARIGPKELITDDAETLRRINGVRSPFVRSDWYEATAFSHEINHASCETDDDLHAERRTKLIPGYFGREIEGMESAMDARIEDLCALIRRKYLSDETEYRPVDLSRICSYFTFEVIYTLAFGSTMGSQEHNKDMYRCLTNH